MFTRSHVKEEEGLSSPSARHSHELPQGHHQVHLDPVATELHTVTINRAPVLTLWCAVVAHYGPSHLEWGKSCMAGRKVAGMLAQSKGRSIGLYERKEDSDEEREHRHRQRVADREHGYRIKIAGCEMDRIRR
jgi:ribosomal protein L21